ncbi:hypothetical protein PR048_021245 [Dryococelus australis]|uniref:Uncharacterized protein n=1 Tax=Dryococelus australis TaxID=614101 RepID=A0ABQ9GXQ3_9NEOP|nr:hypothetical protein PR048_021245 [Dryococelus australis]
MRVIEVWSGAGIKGRGNGRSRENPSTNGIIRHYSQMRKSSQGLNPDRLGWATRCYREDKCKEAECRRVSFEDAAYPFAVWDARGSAKGDFLNNWLLRADNLVCDHDKTAPQFSVLRKEATKESDARNWVTRTAVLRLWFTGMKHKCRDELAGPGLSSGRHRSQGERHAGCRPARRMTSWLLVEPSNSGGPPTNVDVDDILHPLRTRATSLNCQARPLAIINSAPHPLETLECTHPPVSPSTVRMLAVRRLHARWSLSLLLVASLAQHAWRSRSSIPPNTKPIGSGGPPRFKYVIFAGPNYGADENSSKRLPVSRLSLRCTSMTRTFLRCRHPVIQSSQGHGSTRLPVGSSRPLAAVRLLWRGKERGKREIPEKIRRPAASSCTIPTCGNPEVTRAWIEPGSPWKVTKLHRRAGKRDAVFCHIPVSQETSSELSRSLQLRPFVISKRSQLSVHTGRARRAFANVRRTIVEIRRVTTRVMWTVNRARTNTTNARERCPLQVGTSKGFVCSDNLGVDVFSRAFGEQQSSRQWPGLVPSTELWKRPAQVRPENLCLTVRRMICQGSQKPRLPWVCYPFDRPTEPRQNADTGVACIRDEACHQTIIVPACKKWQLSSQKDTCSWLGIGGDRECSARQVLQIVALDRQQGQELSTPTKTHSGLCSCSRESISGLSLLASLFSQTSAKAIKRATVLKANGRHEQSGIIKLSRATYHASVDCVLVGAL